MALSHFSGLVSAGVPVLPGADGMGLIAFNQVYFVDKINGNDGRTGLSLDRAFATVQKALDTVKDFDSIIVMPSSYNEKMTTGQSLGSMTAVTVPVAGRGRFCNLIGASPTRPLPYDNPQLFNQPGTEHTLFIRSQGWRVSGFRIVADVGAPICLRAEMAAAASTGSNNWAPGLTVDHCVIYGAVAGCDGISLKAVGNFRIVSCEFQLFPTAGLAAVTDEPGGFTFPQGHILSCWFRDCKNGIVAALKGSYVQGCTFGPNGENAVTKHLSLSGGSHNVVTGNVMGGDYSTAVYVAGTNDNWNGNFCEDDTEAEVGDNGLSIAVPVA